MATHELYANSGNDLSRGNQFGDRCESSRLGAKFASGDLGPTFTSDWLEKSPVRAGTRYKVAPPLMQQMYFYNSKAGVYV